MDENNTKVSGFDNDIFYLNFSSPLILGLPNIMPNNGNSSTNFNFSIRYFHSNNLAPMKISVNISNKEYSLIETDTSDINYLDGKDYFYVVNKLNIGRHEHYFQATDGKFKWDTKIINLPIVNNIPPIYLRITIMRLIMNIKILMKKILIRLLFGNSILMLVG